MSTVLPITNSSKKVPPMPNIQLPTATGTPTEVTTRLEATNALHILLAIAVEHETELQRSNRKALECENTNEKSSSSCPVFGSFYVAGGSETIQDMQNFDAEEFNNVWSSTEVVVTEQYNSVPGRKGNYSGK